MKIAFFSNYLNHHQASFCRAMVDKLDGNFRFVACSPVPAFRRKLGYADMNQEPFVIRAYESQEQRKMAVEWCMDSDVIIHGSAYERFATLRMEKNLPVFRYSERLFKKGVLYSFSPRARKNLYKLHGQYQNQPMYMLCSSAYTAMDFRRVGAYKNKAFQWGYFPDVKKYDVDELVSKKKSASILWVARLIELKHPEYMINLAKCLKRDGYTFTISIIGEGPLQQQLEKSIMDNGLENCVQLLGSMSPDEVRTHMEQSEIFLFTSDRHEGWGAVMNESMNSGCAVVASHIIGSVPFLVRDGENGLIYRDGKMKDLYRKVRFLLDNPGECARIGKTAYQTMAEQWNAENAADRFVQLAQAVCNGEKYPDLFDEGVCSKAPLLKDGWYKP